MTRNGSATLPRLLASVRPHVDEVCILDTGSADGTLEYLEAQQRAAGAPIVVERDEWRDDYGWARNRTFGMASTDYAIWFDDDEILEGGEGIKTLLESEAPDVLYVRRVEINRFAVSSWWAPRVAKRLLGEWHGRVHERLHLPLDANARVADPRHLRVLHHPVDAEHRHAYEHVLRRLIDEGELRLLPNLASELIAREDYAAAAPLLEQALAPDTPAPAQSGPMRETQAGVWRYLALCRRHLDDREGCWEAWNQANHIKALDRRANDLRGLAAALDRAYPIMPSDPTVWTLAELCGPPKRLSFPTPAGELAAVAQ